LNILLSSAQFGWIVPTMEKVLLSKNRDVEKQRLGFRRKKYKPAKCMVGEGIKQTNGATACATYLVFHLSYGERARPRAPHHDSIPALVLLL
jgi:hypothetical protein